MEESHMADDYERLAEKTELSYEEALALKEEIRKRGESGELVADLVHPATGWRVATRMNKSEAVNFLNAPPPTKPGEASVTNRPDGTVDIYWYGRPSSL
jgi:hypothetical protein